MQLCCQGQVLKTTLGKNEDSVVNKNISPNNIPTGKKVKSERRFSIDRIILSLPLWRNVPELVRTLHKIINSPYKATNIKTKGNKNNNPQTCYPCCGQLHCQQLLTSPYEALPIRLSNCIPPWTSQKNSKNHYKVSHGYHRQYIISC